MFKYMAERNSRAKVIVFDLNGTLTGRVSNHPLHLEYRNSYILKRTQIVNTYLLPENTTYALNACGLNPLRYYIQRNNELNWNAFHSYNDEVYQIFRELKDAGYSIVLYTDCHSVQVGKTLEILKIKPFFDLIITEEYNMKKPSSKAFYFIKERFNCSSSEILAIGNDYTKDLLPFILMGGSGIKIDSENELHQAIYPLLLNKKRKAC